MTDIILYDNCISQTKNILTFDLFYSIIHLNSCSNVGGDVLIKYNELPKEEHLYDLAELFKVFGDSTRIKILYVLFESEMKVCDLSDTLNMTVSAISHQLKILKHAKLVKFRKNGKNVIYSLADDHVRTIIGQGMDHINE